MGKPINKAAILAKLNEPRATIHEQRDSGLRDAFCMLVEMVDKLDTEVAILTARDEGGAEAITDLRTRLAALEKASHMEVPCHARASVESSTPAGDIVGSATTNDSRDRPAPTSAAPDFEAITEEACVAVFGDPSDEVDGSTVIPWSRRKALQFGYLRDWLRANVHRLQAPVPVAPVRDEAWWLKIAANVIHAHRRYYKIEEAAYEVRRTFEPLMQASALDVDEVVRRLAARLDAKPDGLHGHFFDALRAVLNEMQTK